MRLVRGDKLPEDLKKQVLTSYAYRMTVESAERWPHINRYMRQNGYKAQLIGDEQWLKEHAFYVTRGRTLAKNRKHCEPGYLANDPCEFCGSNKYEPTKAGCCPHCRIEKEMNNA